MTEITFVMFKTEVGLIQHKKTHSEEGWPHQCRYCPNSYKTFVGLLIHVYKKHSKVDDEDNNSKVK